ncbi:MAG TPA: DNA repair protein RecO [Nitrospiraceae bacterium]|jgi:DNA repair protein RecO (recombination protein O)|nr:DNA repair protein RecO [Nitrospiraceae bacterium]
MLHRTEAIVLKTTPFSEADLIVTFLSLDYGLLKSFAKSPRKVKSRFGSSLEPLTYSKISFWGREDADLPRLTQSDIVRPFQSIRGNIAVFFKVVEIIELTLNLLPEREPNKGIFYLLKEILSKIEESGGDHTVTHEKAKDFLKRLVLLYKVRFLDMTGYGPALNGCACCSKSGNNFYISHGSVICGACAQGMDTPIRLSPAVIKLYGALRRWEIAKVSRIVPSGTLLLELTNLIDAHLRYTMAKPLKTQALTQA